MQFRATHRTLATRINRSQPALGRLKWNSVGGNRRGGCSLLHTKCAVSRQFLFREGEGLGANKERTESKKEGFRRSIFANGERKGNE